MTAQEAIDEIHRVGAARMDLYRTVDVLERESLHGGGLPAAFRGFADRPQEMARRERHAEIVEQLRVLRGHMDRLRQSVPIERLPEVDHYWDIEHTTSHSQLREMGRMPP